MIKAALIGCGAVSQLYYAPALHELENSNLLKVDSVIDPDPDNRLRLVEHFPDAEMITELEALVNRNIDIAIITSPPDLHAAQTISLLYNGINVFCEKPLSTNSADASAMIRASVDTKKVLAVGLLRRHFSSTQTIRKILQSNILGDLKSFSCQEGHIFRWPVSSASYFDKINGGVLLDIGVHTLDLLIWWLGHPEDIYYEDDAVNGIEVNCRVKLMFKNNIEGEVRLSRDTELQNKYTFYGSKGWLVWDVNEADNIQMGFYDFNYHLSAAIMNSNENSIPYLQPTPTNNFQQSFTAQLIDVLSAVKNRTKLLIPIGEALSSIKIIEYCYKNRNLIKMPWLTDSEYFNILRIIKEPSI